MTMTQSKRRANKDEGFTLIEIVLVLVVLFIISAVTLMVVNANKTMGSEPLIAETDGLIASLRYAQIQSLNENASANWGINFASDSTSYTLYKNGLAATDTNGNPIMIPVKKFSKPTDIFRPFYDPDTPSCPKNCHKMDSKVTITSGSGTTVTFDKWGIPVDGTGVALLVNMEIKLSQGTDPNRTETTITITRNTGFIP
jgi:Tfp pilus assembly major pilin PilA